MTKKQLGQFFTVNSGYILRNLERFVIGKKVIDPFAGSGDLVRWAKGNGAKSIKGYDIDKKYVDHKIVFLNDSINNPKQYDFVLTNPPYLNVNKASDATKENYFKDRGFEDLYHLSLASVMNSNEGIFIVPINFLSAENSKKIRDLFFSKFRIVEMNYFKERVFPDTTYNVIAFYYRRRSPYEDEFLIKAHIYPGGKVVNIKLQRRFHWSIGGDFLTMIKNQNNVLGIYRLTERDVKNGPIKIRAAYNHVDQIIEVGVSKDMNNLIKSNIILLKAIDTGSEEGQIALENVKKHGVECLISKESSRHMIYLVSQRKIPIKEQEKIIELFNQEMNKLRANHLSLFLTNYRDNNRKRVSFDFVYKFINYLYQNKINSRSQKALFANYQV